MMREKLTDREMQEEFARLAETAGDGHDCPPPEKIWLSGRGELEPEENNPVVVHIGDCTACATAWRIARDLAGDQAVTSIADRQTRFSAGKWLPILAAAAVIVVAVGLGIQFLGPPDADTDVIRTQETDWLKSELDESVPLPRESAELLWTKGPDGTLYDVMVSNETGTVLSRGFDLTVTGYTIPVEDLDAIESGDRVLWQVTARMPDQRVLSSETHIAIIE